MPLLEPSGDVCPVCGSEDIRGDHTEWVDGTEGYRPIECGDCESHWREIIKVVGIEALVKGPEYAQQLHNKNDSLD